MLRAGARVLAIELHAGRASHLRARFDPRRLTVLEIDLEDFSPPGRPFRAVASPPYAWSSVLLRRLTTRRSGLTAADLVLQRAATNRLARADAHRGYALSVGLSVPRHAFTPEPRVDSAVLVVRRR